MNMRVEKVIIFLVLGVLILTSINSLSGLGNPLTEEEAIEISKNSELVQEGLAIAFSARARAYTEGHGIWHVVWTIHLGRGGYLVLVLVDAETGIIVHEERGISYD